MEVLMVSFSHKCANFIPNYILLYNSNKTLTEKKRDQIRKKEIKALSIRGNTVIALQPKKLLLPL